MFSCLMGDFLRSSPHGEQEQRQGIRLVVAAEVAPLAQVCGAYAVARRLAHHRL
jgi:hypothetical protein